MMATVSNSTDPPTLPNPVGRAMVLTTALTLPLPTLAVALRMWGRFRYRTPSTTATMSWNDQRFWVFCSDFFIMLSFLTLLALSAVLFYGVAWGEGIHLDQLSPTQTQKALIAYFLYSVFYKFGAGISKIATCFLLYAIATPAPRELRVFRRVCMGLALYVLAYSVACSLATVFQCGGDPRANWIHSLDQSKCFYKPPFWYAHGALNLVAITMTGVLPWWLFGRITYHRKRFVAVLMTLLVVGELVPGLVRFYGLYLSAQHLNDITYITTTGIFVSQLEVEFGVTAACVPTVLRLLAEGWHALRFRLLGVLPPGSSGRGPSALSDGAGQSGRDVGLQTIGGVSSRGQKSAADVIYSSWDEAGEDVDRERQGGGSEEGGERGEGEEEEGGMGHINDSQEKIIARDDRGCIRVQQSYAVSSQSRRSGDEVEEDEAVPAYGRGHARAYLVVGSP